MSIELINCFLFVYGADILKGFRMVKTFFFIFVCFMKIVIYLEYLIFEYVL